jgi:hypothetical protein
MHFLKTAFVLGTAMAFAASAWACDKDQSAKADQVKQQTASTQPVKTDQPTKKPHGG